MSSPTRRVEVNRSGYGTWLIQGFTSRGRVKRLYETRSKMSALMVKAYIEELDTRGTHYQELRDWLDDI